MVRRNLWCFVLALLLVPIAGYTQTVAVAQLSGTVLDDSGAALPGVEVTVTQTDTGMTRFLITAEKGEYVFTNLPVGPYKLSAKLSGFSAFEQTGIVLVVGDARSVNVSMKVGGLTETLHVQADANLVETRSVNVGTLVSQEQIVSLPLNGRSALQLILLSGSAVENTTLTDNRQYPNAVAISVAGGTGNSTMYLVDGGYNNDPQNNTGNPMPFPDALQEFKTENGVRNARYGMSTGATVNAVTKSGTNAYHGNVFDFARDHRFNSIRYFEQKKHGGLGRDDGLRRNQAGGTVGGPILKDKLFFFAGTQVTNTRIAPIATDQTVPTLEVRRGDFRRIMSAACRGGTDRTLAAPYANNQIDPSLYNPIALKMMEMLPLPDPALDPDGCGRYVLQIPNNSDEQQYIGRMDYQATPNKRVFGRVFYTKYIHSPLFDKDNPNLLFLSGSGLGNDARMTTMASGFDWVISPKLVATTRVTLQDTSTLRIQGDGAPTWTSLGVKTFQYTAGNGQDFLAGGTAGWNGSGFTGAFYVLTPSVAQDFDWIKGSHSFSLGGVWTRPHTDGDGTFQSNGNFGFTGLFTSGTTNANGGLPMADFVLGLPATFRQGGSQINDQSINALGLYAGDVWHASRKITLNYGIRWEPYLAAKDANGFTTAFSRANFDKGIKSVVYPNAPAGLLFNGDPDFPTNQSNNRNRLAQFAPRVGVVWDPSGNNQQTIRAGVGHYYDSPKLWQYAHHMLNPPFGNTVNAIAATSCGVPNRNGCAINFADPWATTPGGDPLVAINYPRQGQSVTLPAKDVKFPLQGVYVSMPIDVTPMQVTQWSLSYQRQFLTNMMFDVTYMGNNTTNIWSGYEENPVIYIPGNCVAGQYGLTASGPCSNTTTANRQARSLLTLLNPNEGQYYAANGVAQTFDEARGWYNGVRFSVTRRLSNGWSTSTNYTYSKCTNEGEPGTDINNQFPVPITDITSSTPHPDTSTNKGPCVADRRHNFNLSAVLISPGLGSGFFRTITKDWQTGIIWQARSGSPITPTSTGDTALTNLPQRPILVSGVDPYLPEDQRTWATTGSVQSLAWFNLGAFAQNPPGLWGDVPKGYLVGPSFWNVDLSFSRNVNLAGSRRIELRVEAFNLFNHSNWANPTVQVGSTNLTNGRVTNTLGDPRIMQFAIKYGF
jgi:Carboxypeptidase regulatory-like domain